MICKWCGNSLTAADRNCRRCGREVPARSDCGGFYDLVPNARQPHGGNAVPGQEVPRPQAPQVPYYNRENENARRRKNGQQRLIVMLLSAVCFLLILILLLSINSKVKKCLDILRGDGAQAAFYAGEQLPAAAPEKEAAADAALTAPETAPNQPVSPAEEAPAATEDSPWGPAPETTEAAVPENTEEEPRFALSCENVKAEVTLKRPDDAEQPVEDIEHAPGSISISLGDSALKLTYGTESGEETVICTLAGDISADTAVKWQYKTDDSDSWQELPQQAETPVLRISSNVLKELANGSQLQLRCCLEESIETGTLRIVVAGFRWETLR